MLFMETLQIRGGREEGEETERIDVGYPRKKLEYHDIEKESVEETKREGPKKRPTKPKENWNFMNATHRILKLSTDVKQLRRDVLE